MSYDTLLDIGTGEHRPLKQKKIKRTEPFFMVDLKSAEQIAGMKELHGTEHRVLWFILSRMDYDRRAFPKQSFIAESLGMQNPQVSNAIKALVEAGAIKKIKVDGTNGFEVSPVIASRGVAK